MRRSVSSGETLYQRGNISKFARHGIGVELRRPLGITIVGGLLLSQLLTLYTTPVIYLLMSKLQRGKLAPVPHEPAPPQAASGARS